ncbi:MAG: hypothetical protein ACFCBW_12180 [Candidatus Competibacterales bacterium]
MGHVHSAGFGIASGKSVTSEHQSGKYQNAEIEVEHALNLLDQCCGIGVIKTP